MAQFWVTEHERMSDTSPESRPLEVDVPAPSPCANKVKIMVTLLSNWRHRRKEFVPELTHGEKSARV